MLKQLVAITIVLVTPDVHLDAAIVTRLFVAVEIMNQVLNSLLVKNILKTCTWLVLLSAEPTIFLALHRVRENSIRIY